jgi:hypothetical protein
MKRRRVPGLADLFEVGDPNEIKAWLATLILITDLKRPHALSTRCF